MNKLVVSIFGGMLLIVIVAIGYGKYKDHVDSQLLDIAIFVDNDGDGLPDYSKEHLQALSKTLSELSIPNPTKELIKSALEKTVISIKDLYTSDDLETNIESTKTMRCFYRELSYTVKENKLDIYDLMPLKSSWDAIQYPNGSSKTFLQKKIGKIGARARITNKFCYKSSLASSLRPEPKKGMELFKAIGGGAKILNSVLSF